MGGRRGPSMCSGSEFGREEEREGSVCKRGVIESMYI